MCRRCPLVIDQSCGSAHARQAADRVVRDINRPLMTWITSTNAAGLLAEPRALAALEGDVSAQLAGRVSAAVKDDATWKDGAI
jgi:hypothetical protein